MTVYSESLTNVLLLKSDHNFSFKKGDKNVVILKVLVRYNSRHSYTKFTNAAAG